MSVFMPPLLLLVILLYTPWFHNVLYQYQEAYAGKATKPLL